jgi:ketosteroid isomerase-like protein
MSEQIVELVRRVYEAWNSAGASVIESSLSEGVELVDAPEMPDARTWRGRAAVIGRLEDVSSAVGGGWADLREFRDYGDKVLVNMVWQEDQTKGSPAFAEISHVVKVEAGRITSMRVFLDQTAAEAAASADAE